MAGRAGALMGDVKGGLVASTTCLAFSVANGALIYSGALPSLLTFGIAAALTSTAVTALVFSLTSSFRPVVGTVNSTTAAPLGAIMVAAMPSLATLPLESQAATILALVALATSVTGLVLLILGAARLGTIVRFIPFPIVAGFMGVSGTLVMLGAIRFGTGVKVVWRDLPEFLNRDTALLLGLTIGFGALLTNATKRSKHPLVLPGLLLATVLLTDATTFALGHTVEAPLVGGLFLVSRHPLPAGLPLLLSVPHTAQWSLLPPLLGSVAAYVLLVVLATLLTSTGLEAALNVDADYDRELRSQGWACLVSSACGGLVGNPSVGATMAGFTMGARGRAAGLTNAAVMVLAITIVLPLLAYVPRFVVGGLLAQIAWRIIATWCIATRTKMPLGEWLVVLGIVAVTVWAGMVPAILVGLLAGCIIFAIDVSRISVVRREYGLDRRASKVVRPSGDLAMLESEGRRTRFVELHGMLFFGSAYQILGQVRAILAGERPTAVVLDLTRVTGCDSSATAIIARIRKILRRETIDFAVVGGDRSILHLLETSGCLMNGDKVYTDLDTTLEATEDALLEEHRKNAPSQASLHLWLSKALGNEALATSLIARLRREDHQTGTYLCRQGEPTNTLLFIESGRVAVMVGPPSREICVRVFGPHTLAGEYGFVLGVPRSASLAVERDAQVWGLDRASFSAMQTEQPALVIALLQFIVRQQSERLAFATGQIAMLG